MSLFNNPLKVLRNLFSNPYFGPAARLIAENGGPMLKATAEEAVAIFKESSLTGSQKREEARKMIENRLKDQVPDIMGRAIYLAIELAVAKLA